MTALTIQRPQSIQAPAIRPSVLRGRLPRDDSELVESVWLPIGPLLSDQESCRLLKSSTNWSI